MRELFKQLAAPFEPSAISWRVGSTSKDKTKALALAYIDARDVMKRLDEIVGPENWQDRYEVHGGKTVCYLSLWLEHTEGPQDPAIESRYGRWVTKADAAGDSAVEAEKGAISDAFKRAAVKWGIGRYLYDLDSPWVMLEGTRIAKGEYAKLEKLLGGNFKAELVEPPYDPEKDPNFIKAKRVVEKGVAALSPLADQFARAEWISDPAKADAVKALRWVKETFPDLMQPIEALGLTL